MRIFKSIFICYFFCTLFISPVVSIGTTVLEYNQSFDALNGLSSMSGTPILNTSFYIEGKSAQVDLDSSQVNNVLFHPDIVLTENVSANISFYWSFEVNETNNYTVGMLIDIHNGNPNHKITLAYILNHTGNPFISGVYYCFNETQLEISSQRWIWNFIEIVDLRSSIISIVNQKEEEYGQETDLHSFSLSNSNLSIETVSFFMYCREVCGYAFIDECNIVSYNMNDENNDSDGDTDLQQIFIYASLIAVPFGCALLISYIYFRKNKKV